MTRSFITISMLLAACNTLEEDPQPTPTGRTSDALTATCFHTENAVLCAPTPGGPAGNLKIKVKDFYPSACADGDADGDGIADFLDIDFLGSETPAAVEDDLRCPVCNRGPGTQNDFRLEVRGTEAKLDRGKVYLAEMDVYTVPTTEGTLTVFVTPETEVDDGIPAPGAEIRAEGTMAADGSLVAERLKVLCPAPAAMPKDEVPPDAEPPVIIE